MLTRIGIATGLTVLGLVALFTVGCEDTGVTAPADSTITLIASPAAISINQEAGETQGSTSLVCQLLNVNGLPQSGIPLFFSSTGGLLASVDNVCVVDTCIRSLDPCVNDSDCPFVPPSSIVTDSDGHRE